MKRSGYRPTGTLVFNVESDGCRGRFRVEEVHRVVGGLPEAPHGRGWDHDPMSPLVGSLPCGTPPSPLEYRTHLLRCAGVPHTSLGSQDKCGGTSILLGLMFPEDHPTVSVRDLRRGSSTSVGRKGLDPFSLYTLRFCAFLIFQQSQ